MCLWAVAGTLAWVGFGMPGPNDVWGACAIVMDSELSDRPPEVPFVERNEVVETLAPDGSDEPLAPRVGRWRPDGSLQYPDAAVPNRLIDVLCEDGVSVMDQKPVRVIERKEFAKLLDAPFRRRMDRDVRVQNAARADLHRNEHVKKSERSRHRNQEVAGHDALRVIADERIPSLSGVAAARTACAQVLSDRPRRNPDSELQQQFIRNSLFTPGRVFLRDSANEFADFPRRWWTAHSPRFPFPECSERRSVPLEKGLRLNDHERIAPRKEPRQRDHREADGARCLPRLDLAFCEQRELLSQEQIFSDECGAGGEEQPEEGEQIPILLVGSLIDGSGPRRRHRDLQGA